MPRTTAICIANHRKTFRGWFIDYRLNRWWEKHEHPEIEQGQSWSLLTGD